MLELFSPSPLSLIAPFFGATYHPVLLAYASLFSTAVALNFAYTASGTFRTTIGSGFNETVEHLKSHLTKVHEDAQYRCTVSTVDVFREEYSEQIKTKFDQIKTEILSMSESLDEDIKHAENGFKDLVMPSYMVAAIFTIFVLFLIGQESFHQLLPITEMSTMIVTSAIVMIIVTYLTTTRFRIFASNPYIGLYMISLNMAIILFPCDLSPYFFKDKYVINAAIVVGFLPFFITTILFLIRHLTLAWKYGRRYLSVSKKIRKLNKLVDTIKPSKDLFN